ncbi:hypothetical protein KC19_2G060500 [Ceratodon purpureus]|uniref:Rhodanese domain-containing protein n=2 Tax=Ceratodon purpureus TaxID=3225 RepID=A0A8T0ITR8_CERPU|nr:hypothetical protein KC19_2G060500 [Ceratodon purpureus]
MESLLTRSTVSTGQAGRGCLRPSSFVGQQSAVQLQQQGRLCNSGKALKKLRILHSSPRASIRDVERMLRSGDIATIAPQNAKPLLSDETSAYRLLDVRPMWEREKAFVAESIHVPLFVEDTATDAVTLLKKQIQFGFGGAWLGQRFTKPNDSFLAQVEEVLPSKNEKIIVACGEGMRSMMAIEELMKAGYSELVWLGGGFNNVRDGDFVTIENGTKLQWATVGGASELFLKFAVLLSNLSNSISGSSAVKEK